MTVSIVQTGYTHPGAASGGTITLGSNVTSGDGCLLVHESANQNQITGISGGGFSNWAVVSTAVSAAVGVLETWFGSGSTGGSKVLTITYNAAGSSSDECWCAETSPAKIGGKSIVTSAGTGGPYSSMTSGTLPTQAGAMLVAYAKTAGNGGVLTTVPSGYTAVTGLATNTHAIDYQTGLAVGSNSVTYAISTTNDNGYVGLVELVTATSALTSSPSAAASITGANTEQVALSVSITTTATVVGAVYFAVTPVTVSIAASSTVASVVTATGQFVAFTASSVFVATLTSSTVLTATITASSALTAAGPTAAVADTASVVASTSVATPSVQMQWLMGTGMFSTLGGLTTNGALYAGVADASVTSASAAITISGPLAAISLTAAISATSSASVVDSFDTVMASLAPVGWWKLNDAVSSTTATDSSGNGFTGTVQTGVVMGQPGLIRGANTAALFPATTSEITVPDATLLDYGTGSFSSFIWVQIPSGIPSNNPTLISKQGSPAGFRAYIDTLGYAHFYIEDASSNSINPNLGINICDGRPHFFGMVVDRTAQTLTLYQDGVAGAPNACGTVGSVTSTGAPYFMGSLLAGVLAESSTLSYALTAAQVATLYAAGIGGNAETAPLTAAVAGSSVSGAVGPQRTVALTATVSALSSGPAPSVTESVALSSAISMTSSVASTTAKSAALTAAIAPTMITSANGPGIGLKLNTAILSIATSTADVTATTALTGAIVVNSTVGANPGGSGTLDASIAGALVANISSNEAVALAAILAASSTVAAAPRVTVALTAAIAASSTVAAGMTIEVVFSASISAAATVVQSLAVGVALTSSISDTSSAGGGAVSAVALASSLSGTSSALGSVLSRVAVTGSLLSSVTVAATLAKAISLTAAISATSAAAATTVESTALTAPLGAASSVSGTPTVAVALTASVAASSSAGATGPNRTIRITASVSAVASASTPTVTVQWLMLGTGMLLTLGGPTTNGALYANVADSSVLTGATGVAAGILRKVSITAAVVATSAVTALTTEKVSLSSSVVSSASSAGSNHETAALTAAPAGSATVAATPSAKITITSVVAGSVAVQATTRRHAQINASAVATSSVTGANREVAALGSVPITAHLAITDVDMEVAQLTVALTSSLNVGGTLTKTLSLVNGTVNIMITAAGANIQVHADTADIEVTAGDVGILTYFTED